MKILNNKGSGGLYFIAMMFSTMVVAGILYQQDKARVEQTATQNLGNRFVRKNLIEKLRKDLTEENSLIWNMKIEENKILRACLIGPSAGTACSEDTSYGLILLEATAGVQNNGRWSPKDSSHKVIAVGQEDEKNAFYDLDGTLCTNPLLYKKAQCPYQLLAEFIPFCHGNLNNPTQDLYGTDLRRCYEWI